MGQYHFESSRYPEEPGCYLMKGADDNILYVGKAINLRKRLASYFGPKPDRPKTGKLVKEISDIEIVIVRNENESLALEANLIQHYRPPYNRALKRSQAVYPYIVRTPEKLPRLLAWNEDRLKRPEAAATSARTEQGDVEGEKIGPFPTRVFRDYALEYSIERFGLRTCHPVPNRVCMRYYLHQCGGICEDKQSRETYVRNIEKAQTLLADAAGIPIEMDRTVAELAERLQFEKAHELHKRAKAMRSMLQDQAVNVPQGHHQLVVYFGAEHAAAATVEYGLLRSSLVWLPLHEGTDGAEEWPDQLSSLLPREAGDRIEIVSNDAGQADKLKRYMSSAGCSVRSTVPLRGAKKQLLGICERNYRYRKDQVPPV